MFNLKASELALAMTTQPKGIQVCLLRNSLALRCDRCTQETTLYTQICTCVVQILLYLRIPVYHVVLKIKLYQFYQIISLVLNFTDC